MWLGIWSGRRKHEQKWKDLVKRYEAFLPTDTIILCADHHAEIHQVYDDIISADKQTIGLPLSKYSWRQAEQLMSRLAAVCGVWLSEVSPGINSDTFGKERRREQQERRTQRITRSKRKRNSH